MGEEVDDRREHDDDGGVERGVLGQLADGGGAGLRGLKDEGLDLAEGRVFAGAGDLDFEAAGLVDGAAEDLVAVGLFDGEGLAGDVGLVKGGDAAADDPVARHVVAGEDEHAVAGLQRRGVNFLFPPVVVEAYRAGRGDADERLDGLERPDGGAVFDE